MKTNQVVIGSTVVYVGTRLARYSGPRSRVLEVHRFNEPENEIGPCTLPALVMTDEATLKRHGGLKPGDRLAVALLDGDGLTAHLYPAREMAFIAADGAMLPNNWFGLE